MHAAVYVVLCDYLTRDVVCRQPWGMDPLPCQDVCWRHVTPATANIWAEWGLSLFPRGIPVNPQVESDDVGGWTCFFTLPTWWFAVAKPSSSRNSNIFRPRTMVKPKLWRKDLEAGRIFFAAVSSLGSLGPFKSCRIVAASHSSRATMSCMLFVAASGMFVYCMEHYWDFAYHQNHQINIILTTWPECSSTVKCRKPTQIP